MLLEQEFKRAEDGTRLLDHESITVEFKLTEGQDGIFARRVADYTQLHIYSHCRSGQSLRQAGAYH